MCLAVCMYTAFQKGTNFKMSFHSPFSPEILPLIFVLFRDYVSYSYCYTASVGQIWVFMRSNVYFFTKGSLLQRKLQVFREERCCVNEQIKAEVPHSFIDFVHIKASCPGTYHFQDRKDFLLLSQVFLVNCFLKDWLDLLCVLWQYACILCRNTILWHS